MKIVYKGKRKAISPVLATVILIAITLIAAVAIAGFVFGLFGSFTSSPQLTASNVNCYALPLRGATQTHSECSMLLQNTGTGNAGIISCSISVAGVQVSGGVFSTTGGVAAVTSVAGNTAPITDYCYITSAANTAGAVGSTAGGNIVTSAATVPFAGTWS